MKKTLFMACVLAPALACAGESYRVQNAAEFQTAWAAATDGDTIAVAGDVDWSALTAPLQDKDGSICVSAEGDSKIVWQGPGAAIPLPKGLQLQNITLFNAPGALWQGTDIAIGQGVRLIQSQGVDSAVIVAAGGKADVMAGAGFDTLASPGMGGAIRIGDGATAAIHGGVTFDNNAAQGLGGAIAVENQTASGDTANLSLIADTGDIIFSGNQSEAVSENGAWLGFPNDIYLGENASMRLSTAEGREIRLGGGVESADGSARIVKTGKGHASLGEGSFYNGSLAVQEGAVILNGEWGGESTTVGANGALILEQGTAIYNDVELVGGTLTVKGPASIEGNLSGNGLIRLEINPALGNDTLLGINGSITLSDDVSALIVLADEVVQAAMKDAIVLTLFNTNAMDEILKNAIIQADNGNILEISNLTASNGVVTFSVVPEPTTATLSLSALLLLLGRRRRPRQHSAVNMKNVGSF